MSAADTPMAPEPSQPKLSEMERILNIFTAPSKTFEDLKRSAMWIAPALLMVAFGMVFAWTVGQRVGWEQVFQNNMKMAPASQQERFDQIPADQKARVMAQQLVITKVISFCFPVFGIVALVIVALILWGTFTFGAGKEVSFGRAMAIVVYSTLPAVIKSLLAIIMLWIKVPEDFFIQNAIGTNIGHYLAFSETPRFLYSIATALDIFMIWTLVLTAMGFSIVANVKRGTANTIVFGWWIAVTLIGAGLSAAFA